MASYPTPPAEQTPKDNAERRFTDVRRARVLRLAAHVVEIFGADFALDPTDLPLILGRPVGAREAHAAVAAIGNVRRERMRLLGTVVADREYGDLDVEILRAEATLVLKGKL